MWSREVLKGKAKERLQFNYWKMVLMALISAVIAGGVGSSVSSMSSDRINSQTTSAYNSQVGSYSWDMSIGMNQMPGSYSHAGLSGTAIFVIVVVAVLATAAVLAAGIFVYAPCKVSIAHFFYENIRNKENVSDFGFAFDNNYKNIVRLQFYRALYTFLWTLLFIIPGIVKTYEYRMIPYLLAEHPEMGKEEAFAISRRMMDGNKWKAFVFDLSFFGWEILSLLTCGLVGVFYVNPYYSQACAMLYDAIKYDDQMKYQNSQFTN